MIALKSLPTRSPERHKIKNGERAIGITSPNEVGLLRRYSNELPVAV
jgi:hypothetical protein